MNDQPCIRCHQPVLLDDGHLVYCSHCGAPQIFLSDELQTELTENIRTYRERLITQQQGRAEAVDAPLVRKRWNSVRGARRGAELSPWTTAVSFALLSAAVALALGLLSLLLPAAGALLVLWVVAAPVVTVGLFQARAATGRVLGSQFGARLGLLTGLLVGFCCAVTFTLSLVLTRFVFHQAAPLDAQIAASFAQQRATLVAKLGSNVQPTLDMLSIPEFRVGLLMTVLATTGTLYLALSTISGGVAGLLLRGRRSA